jgi:hypothetical protein
MSVRVVALRLMGLVALLAALVVVGQPVQALAKQRIAVAHVGNPRDGLAGIQGWSWMAIRAMALGAIRAMEKRAIPRTGTGAMQWPETLAMVTAPPFLQASMVGPSMAGRWQSLCLWRSHLLRIRGR